LRSEKKQKKIIWVRKEVSVRPCIKKKEKEKEKEREFWSIYTSLFNLSVEQKIN